MEKVILVDADDTLYDTLPALLEEYGRITGDVVPIDEITEWDISGILKYPDVMEKIFRNPNFFYNLKLKEGAYDLMRRLNAFHEVQIVTAGHVECLWGKEEAFLRDFPFLTKENFTYGWNKGIYKGDVMIDDNLKNHKMFQATNPNGLSVVIDMPHNRAFNLKHARVKRLIEILDIPIIAPCNSRGLLL